MNKKIKEVRWGFSVHSLTESKRFKLKLYIKVNQGLNIHRQLGLS